MFQWHISTYSIDSIFKLVLFVPRLQKVDNKNTSLSLSRSLLHAQTYTHTQQHTHSLSFSIYNTHTLSFFLCRTDTNGDTQTNTHTHTHTHSLSLSHTILDIQTHAQMYTHSHTITHALSLLHTGKFSSLFNRETPNCGWSILLRGSYFWFQLRLIQLHRLQGKLNTFFKVY